MSGEAAFAVKSWPVGARTCTLTMRRPNAGAVVNVTCEWAPDEPTRLSSEEWREYRAGRDSALTQIGEELGVNVAVLEL